MSNKQSSVEWLWDKFVNESIKISDLAKLLEQAKAMHKEEQKIAYHAKLNDWYFDFEHYYNEAFGGQDANI